MIWIYTISFVITLILSHWFVWICGLHYGVNNWEKIHAELKAAGWPKKSQSYIDQCHEEKK